MLKSKIHRATVTAASVDYEGSITIDSRIMEAADIFTCEQVHVLDVENGARLVTYAIPGGPGEICVNGAAARKVNVGDKVIILSYGGLVPREWEGFQPRTIRVDEDNKIIKIDTMTVSTGAAAIDEGTPHHAGAGSSHHSGSGEKESDD